MSSFVINGGNKLQGSIGVNGSKNAALPLLAASLLTPEKMTLTNVPPIKDVARLLEIMSSAKVKVKQVESTIEVDSSTLAPDQIPQEVLGKLRGSILLLGALLGRYRIADIALPGGDIIGARPIDVHLDALTQLGAKVVAVKDTVKIDGTAMKAGPVVLQEFSVTATENIMLVAATLPGKTTIDIAAAEPHVVALAKLLTKMGAKVSGAGSHTISIEGQAQLKGVTFANIQDTLEAGLFILLAAATKSNLSIEGVSVPDLSLFFKKLDDIGVNYSISGTTVKVKSAELKNFKVQTLPQPGIATDLQAPFAVMATQANGTSLIHDPMYESRFRHCDELKKMGANVTVCDPHRVIIEGPTPLFGQAIHSLDIRSGATLIMAALVAEGRTIIHEAEIIDRGYANLVERLQAIGADIKRIDD